MKTKSQIFKEAHKLAKTFEGDYNACFSLALKVIYSLNNIHNHTEIRSDYKSEKLFTVSVKLDYSQNKERDLVKWAGFKWNSEKKIWESKNRKSLPWQVCELITNIY